MVMKTLSEDETEKPTDWVSVRFSHQELFADLLQSLGCSLLVSTYQAGQVITIGSDAQQLQLTFQSFDRPMGIAVASHAIAVGSRRRVDFFEPVANITERLPGDRKHDSLWLARSSKITGALLGHDLGWGSEGLWVVNTLFSGLCTLDEKVNFVPRWKPPFVSQWIDQDRCHLNGLAIESGVPRYVTTLGETDSPAGWRETKANGGTLIDVASDAILARGLCMPHSPRVYRGQIWVLESGKGHLSLVDRQSGRLQAVALFPGYTRGLAFAGDYAFVGLSKIRETNVFGGLPIGEYSDQLRSGIGVIDLRTGATVATLQFHEGVDEIFAVEVLPNTTSAHLIGPSLADDEAEVWIVPPPHPILPAAEMEQARQVLPDSPDLLNQLGNLHQDLGDQAKAIECYQQAVKIDPGYSVAHKNLGVLLAAHNAPSDALKHFDAAHASQPDARNLVLAAKVLPVIYESHDHLRYWRDRFTQRVHDLVDAGIKIDTTNSLADTSFFLAYQGQNDRDIMLDLGQIYEGARYCEPASVGSTPQGKRIRIGFLSAYFRDHTIGRLNLGRIQYLCRDRFEVVVLSLSSSQDSISHEFQQAADHFVRVPRDPAKAREQIAALGLDVLLFTDVGMDALTQTLAYSRVAPRQVVTWGHPDTTGSPTIDYFLSSKLAEIETAQDHYTERLVQLRSLGIHYARPEPSTTPRTRDFFGIDPAKHWYVCPQTLFKFHPDFDETIQGILETDKDGLLVLIEGRVATWTNALLARWQRSMPHLVQRIKFLRPLPRPDFLELLRLAEVALDPYPFGGGNTTYEALAMGTPVVTFPGDHLRGRLAFAMLQRMDFVETVAHSSKQYVQLACQIASDRPYRTKLQQQITTRSACLFNNGQEVDDFQSALLEICER